MPDPDLHMNDGADDRSSLAPSSREDVEELRKGLPRHQEITTDQTLELIERIPISLAGGALEDLNGRPLGAALIGSIRLKSAAETQDSKVITGDMGVLEVLPRACRLLFPREDRKEGESPFKDRLPTSTVELRMAAPSVVMGTSAVTSQPVYMLRLEPFPTPACNGLICPLRWLRPPCTRVFPGIATVLRAPCTGDLVHWP